MADQPEPGVELIIQHPEKRFNRRHARVIRRLELVGALEINENLPDGYVDGELQGDELLITERVIAAPPCGAIRMGEVIERIIACDNLERPVATPVRMPAPPTQQRAGRSGRNVHFRHFAVAWTQPMKICWSDQCVYLAFRTWRLPTVITSRKMT